MIYNFDNVINRQNTHSVKWDGVDTVFKSSDVLPLWVADMDFPAPEPVIQALISRAEHGIFGYTHLQSSYFESVVHWMKKRHDWKIESEWVTFCPGVVPALIALVKTMTVPGDKVMVQPPVYPPFFRAVETNGCTLVLNPLIHDNGRYVMDFSDMENKMKEGIKLFILCHPHNPVGRVWTEEELSRLIELCRQYDVTIISDEIHSDLVYSGQRHIPLPLLCDELFQQKIIVCTAPSKTFNLAGLQTSNIIIANPDDRKAFRKEMSSSISSPNSFGGEAMEAAYNYGEEWLDQLLLYLEGNYFFLANYIKERIKPVMVTPLEATYLIWLDFRQLGMKDSELQHFLVHQCRLGLNPGTNFGAGGEGFARMNIACPRATLAEGLKRLEEGIQGLK